MSDNIQEEKLPLDYSISKLFWGIPVQQAFEIGGYIDGVVQSARQTGQIECEFRDKIIEGLKGDIKESEEAAKHLRDGWDACRAELESLRKERDSYKRALQEIDDKVMQYHRTYGNNGAANHLRNIAIEALSQYPAADKPPINE